MQLFSIVFLLSALAAVIPAVITSDVAVDNTVPDGYDCDPPIDHPHFRVSKYEQEACLEQIF